VERIAEQPSAAAQEERGEVLYSIYSGGDDLFFVGAWDVVVELARQIRADLTDFAAGHPGIHASAGIVLVGGKYPLYQAAADAGVAEGAAKSLKWRSAEGVEDADRSLKRTDAGQKRTKDAVAFLGQALPWDRFGLEPCKERKPGTVHGLAHTLVDMVAPQAKDNGRVPQALLRNLIHVQQMYEDAAEQRRQRGEDLNQAGEEQVYWGPWMWRGYYYLKRMVRRYQDERGQAIDELAEGLHGDGFRAIEWIGLAARWADLLTR
jgi:CRISPR-associated protein Csm1